MYEDGQTRTGSTAAYPVYRRCDFLPDEKVTSMCEDVVIGQGSYGLVYHLKHADLGNVAVKTLLGSGDLYDGEDEEVWNEVEVLSRFRHPNVITIYGLIMEPNNYSLVLEYAVFGDLYAYRKSRGEIPWSSMVSFTGDILKGLAFLHMTARNKRPITHGNINPSTILVCAGDIAKVSSYGLNIVNEITHQEITPVSCENRFRTSLCYMAPEIYQDHHLSIGEKTDVYSFGVTLYEMMTGCTCNDDSFTNQLILCRENGKQLKVESIPTDCPDILKATFELSTCKRPEDRPRFSDLLEELNMSSPPQSYTAWDVTLHNGISVQANRWIVYHKKVFLASLYNKRFHSAEDACSVDSDSSSESSRDLSDVTESGHHSTDENEESEPGMKEGGMDSLGPLPLGMFSDPNAAEYWGDCREDILRLIRDIDESEFIANKTASESLRDYRQTLKQRLEKIDSKVDDDNVTCLTTDLNSRAFPLPRDIRADPLCLRSWVTDWEPFDTGLPEDGWVWKPSPLLEEETEVNEKTPWYGDWEAFDTSIDGDVAWSVLPIDVIRTDKPTDGQLTLIASRKNRKHLCDESIMNRRRQRLAEYFRDNYHFKPEIIRSHLGFVSRLKENDEKLKCLAESSNSFIIR